MTHNTTTFNPWSIEAQYGLDMLAYLLYRSAPHSVYVCSSEPDAVVALVRRLYGWVDTVFVDNTHIATVLAQRFNFKAELYQQTSTPEAVCMLFPSDFNSEPPQAKAIFVMAHNAISYRGLLHPRSVSHTFLTFLRWLKSSYHIHTHVGMLGPKCIGALALSQLAGAKRPVFHFRTGQWAIDRIYTQGFMWWLSYVVILAGNHKNNTTY